MTSRLWLRYKKIVCMDANIGDCRRGLEDLNLFLGTGKRSAVAG
jgi:hypothetical protein